MAALGEKVFYVLVWLAVAVPDAVYIGVFSAMGAGPALYSYAADDDIDKMGSALGLGAGLWIVLLFIFDWNPVSPWQFPCGVVLFGIVFAASIFKAVAYPWTGGFMCLAALIALLGFLRAHHLRLSEDGGMQGIGFYSIVVFSFFTSAFIIAAAWFIWLGSNDRWWSDETKTWLAEKNEDVYEYFEVTVAACKSSNTTLTDEQQSLVTSKCKKSETVWFLQWSCPFVAIVCNCVCGLLCVVFDRPNLHEKGNSSQAMEAKKHDLKLLLQRCVLILAFGVACMYTSLYVSGASTNLGSALLCLAAAGTSLLLGWMYLEIDHKLISEVAHNAPFASYAIKAAKSDWIRAFAVGGLHLFIPFTALLDMVKQKVRLCKGTDDKRQERFTTKGRVVAHELSTWNWVSIFSKVIFLGELFVVMIVGSKFTFVFFSWLNEELAAADLKFGVVSAMVFVIGFAMFMCPIVPGSAVYLFAGVVLGAQAQIEGSVGFWPGTCIACVVGSLAKLMACCGQYGLGFVAGKSVKVQKFVGVDKVPTRAMEQVLKMDGMNPGKVCILVAGPDFPVSMLCGILRLNIPQMLMGTLPVILVSIIPQTLVGALLTKDGGDTGVWSMISTGVTGFAAVFQAGATFIYIYFIMKTIEADGEKLAQPRAEHAAVAELSKQEESYVVAYKEVTQWNEMGSLHKLLILSATAAFLIAGFVIASDFVVTEKYCFRSFSITDRIGAPYDLGGLDNNALNLVMTTGKCALGLVVVGFLLNYLLGKLLACKARQQMTLPPKDRAKNKNPTTDGILPPVGVGPPEPVPLGAGISTK